MLYPILATVSLYSILSALSAIDIKTHRLPDRLNFLLIGLGLFYNFNLAEDFYPFLVGAVAGYALFWILEHLYRMIRQQEGLGRGDAKLLAGAGAWCGWMALPYIILIASSSALIWVLLSSKLKSKPDEQDTHKQDNNNAALAGPLTQFLAFGPFLSLGIAIIWASLLWLQFSG